MLLILGTIRLPPDRVEEARPVMARMAQASRSETGCVEYVYAEDVMDRGLIHVQERWADRDTLAAHFASSHLAEWRAAWPRLGIGERNLVLYEIGKAEPL